MFYVYATQLLRDDHKTLRGLFRQYESYEDGQQRESITDEILDALQIHSEIEEQIFYPTLGEQDDPTAKTLVEQALSDHKQIDQMVGQIRELPMRGEYFHDMMAKLIADTEDHMTEEEDEILPLAESIISMHLGDLGRRMENRKQELTDDMQKAA